MDLPSWHYREYEPDEAEPGSDGRVLRNKLGIKDPGILAATEELLLEEAYAALKALPPKPGSISCADIRQWHKLFLEKLYKWAGEYRTVEISLPRDDFGFCLSKHIHSCMEHYERNLLADLTPLRRGEPETHLRALAELHAEFIIIHPFRDGNGRVSRFMVDWLLLAAEETTIDWEKMLRWEPDRKSYYSAISAAAAVKNYEPLAALLRDFSSS